MVKCKKNIFSEWKNEEVSTFPRTFFAKNLHSNYGEIKKNEEDWLKESKAGWLKTKKKTNSKLYASPTSLSNHEI